MSYQGILFDKDGTLIDFNSTWLPVYRYASLELANHDQLLADELLNQHGYNPDENRFIGGSLLAASNTDEIARVWCNQLTGTDDDKAVQDMCARLDQIFQQQGALNSTPVTNLQSTLRQLKNKGNKLGVATSDSYHGIHNTLQDFEVLPEFDFLCGYDSGHGIKPEPGMVLAFCQAVSLEPADIIVVGDNKHDIEMGKSAGAGCCVGVLTGTSTREELETLADFVFEDITGLVDLIDN